MYIIYIYIYVYIYTHTHIHTYTDTYIHTYVRTYVHTYIQAGRQAGSMHACTYVVVRIFSPLRKMGVYGLYMVDNIGAPSHRLCLKYRH